MVPSKSSSADCGEASLSFANATGSSVDVMYSSTVALSGFQFNATGVTLTGATMPDGGLSDVSVGGNFVLGFDMNGGSVPAGEGLLVTLNLALSAEGSTIGLSDLVVSSFDAVELPSSSTDGSIPVCGNVAGGACDCDGNADLGCGFG